MYGKKKKIIIVVIIGIVLLSIIGIAIHLLSNKEERLGIKYIGGDKYVDARLTAEDFEVTDLKSGNKISSKKLKISAEPLNMDGTIVTISTTLDGNEYSGQITVYPTLVITSIKAELIPTNKHIGSKISKKDFKVIGKNNNNKEVRLKDFTLDHSTLKQAENDVKIEYKTSVGTVSTTLHISVTENFVKGVKAKYNGKAAFIGQDVDEDAFDVYAIWDDDEETKMEEYNIEDPTLTSSTTVVTVSITDDLGKTFYTDVKVKAVNYVVDIDHVSYVGQEQTIGNTVEKSDFEVYGIYYDGSIKKVDNFKFKSSAVLKATENTITIGLTNEIGSSIEYQVGVNAEQNIIYVGDSRIKELQAYNKSEEAKEANGYNEKEEKCYYIYSDRADYNWFESTAKGQIQSILDKNPYTTFRIVISIGTFDFNNINKYLTSYEKLARTTWKNQRMYIDSLNPVDETQMEKSGVYSRKDINTTKINDFNKQLNQSIANYNLTNLKYINTYGSLTNNAFKTKDGFNYTNETYQVLHDSVKELSI